MYTNASGGRTRSLNTLTGIERRKRRRRRKRASFSAAEATVTSSGKCPATLEEVNTQLELAGASHTLNKVATNICCQKKVLRLILDQFRTQQFDNTLQNVVCDTFITFNTTQRI